MTKIWICQNVVMYATTSPCNYGDTKEYYKCSDKLS